MVSVDLFLISFHHQYTGLISLCWNLMCSQTEVSSHPHSPKISAHIKFKTGDIHRIYFTEPMGESTLGEIALQDPTKGTLNHYSSPSTPPGRLKKGKGRDHWTWGPRIPLPSHFLHVLTSSPGGPVTRLLTHEVRAGSGWGCNEIVTNF